MIKLKFDKPISNSIKEAEIDIAKSIKDFIDTEWSKSDEAKGKAMNILKGLIYSDDAKAKKFIKDLDSASNKLKADDYK